MALVWSDNITIALPQVLARASSVRFTQDWSAKYGGYLSLNIGHSGTTALTNGVDVYVRRTFGANTIHTPGAMVSMKNTVTAANARTLGTASAASGASGVVIASAAALVPPNVHCLLNATATITAGTYTSAMFRRLAKAITTSLDYDTPFDFAVIAASVIYDQADSWTVWVDGGCTVEIIFDYGDDAAGENVVIAAYAQTLDSL